MDPDFDDFADEDDEPEIDAPPDVECDEPEATAFEDPVEAYDEGDGED